MAAINPPFTIYFSAGYCVGSGTSGGSWKVRMCSVLIANRIQTCITARALTFVFVATLVEVAVSGGSIVGGAGQWKNWSVSRLVGCRQSILNFPQAGFSPGDSSSAGFSCLIYRCGIVANGIGAT